MCLCSEQTHTSLSVWSFSFLSCVQSSDPATTPIFALAYFGSIMRTDGLCVFFLTSLQLFTLPPHNFKCFIVCFCFFSREWDELSRFVKGASLEFIVWWKWWEMKGQEVWGMSWQMTEMYTCQLFMGTHICLGFPLIPICNVAINAHLEPRNQKLALSTVWKKKNKSTGSTPSMSSYPLRE